MIYSDTATHDSETFEMCLSATRAEHSDVVTAMERLKGKCKMTTATTGNGSFVTDGVCSLGDQTVTVHESGVIEDTPNHQFGRIEMVSRVQGGPHAVRNSIHWDDSFERSECPAGLLPGQRLMPDGGIVDPLRLARGHFGGTPASAGAADAEASLATPPIRRAPLAAASVAERSQIDCEPTINGAIEFNQANFPFGPSSQPWRVRLRLQINPDGQPYWAMDVETPNNRESAFYDREPNYTVRVGGAYAITPPIAQHGYVFGYGGPPLTRDAAKVRTAARDAAQARGDTYCYVFSCIPSETETKAFLGALEATARINGDLTISGNGPNGPVTLRYPLSGLQGLSTRLLQCRK